MPDLRNASERMDKDLERERATHNLEWAVRELAANIMRVTRGAGRPVEVAPQAAALVKAAQGYWDAHQRWPAEELYRFLDADSPLHERASDESNNWRSAQNEIVAGALQVAASNLVGQSTQRAAGERQMMRGVGLIEQVHEQNAEKWRTRSKPTTIS